MKLTLENLSAQLERGLAGAWLVSGDEPLRVGEATDQIRARARVAGFTNARFSSSSARARSGNRSSRQDRRCRCRAASSDRVRLPTGKAGAAGRRAEEAD